MKRTSWFIFLMLFAFSCLDEPECYQLNNDEVGMVFRVMGSNRTDMVGVRRFVVLDREGNPLIMWDKARDSLINGVGFKLDYFGKNTSLVLGRGERLDTIMLEYQVQAQYVSEECGPRYILSNLNPTNLDRTQIPRDSIRIVNGTPSRTAGARNIEIFRCPRTDTMAVQFHQLLLPNLVATPSAARSVEVGVLHTMITSGSQPIYENINGATLRLPVDLSNTTTSYSFQSPEWGERNLAIEYATTTESRYKPCGQQTFVSRLRRIDTPSPFDSVSFGLDTNGALRTVLTDPYETTLHIYRCPPTNMIRIAFVRTPPGATAAQAVTMPIVNISTNYTSELFYQNTSANAVELPINLNATSTTFTFNFEDRVETVTANYTVGRPPALLFKEGFSCSSIRVVTGLTVSNSSLTAGVPNPGVLYPPVTNITLAIPE